MICKSNVDVCFIFSMVDWAYNALKVDSAEPVESRVQVFRCLRGLGAIYCPFVNQKILPTSYCSNPLKAFILSKQWA